MTVLIIIYNPMILHHSFKLCFFLKLKTNLHLPHLSVNCRIPRMEFDPMDFADSLLDGFGGGEEAVAEVGKTKYKSKNLEAERRRRSKLNHRLFTLRSLVPNITKMSKESTLVDAIDYIHILKTQICDLKLELSNIPDLEDHGKRGSASSSESMTPSGIVPCMGKLEISSVGRNKFQVKLTYEYKPGRFTAVLEAVARHGLQVTEISSFAHSGLSQTVLCIEAKDGKEVSMVELRKVLLVIVGESEDSCR